MTLSILGSSFISAASASNTTLMAGAAETVITPAWNRKPDWDPVIYEDLHARALVLADSSDSSAQGGRQHLAIVTLDHLGMPVEANDVLLRIINRATGIPKEKIATNYSYTHNHQSPSGDDGRWNKEEQMSTAMLDIPYDEWLAEDADGLNPFEKWRYGHIAEVVKRAADNLQPATLRVGREPVQIGYNRNKLRGDQIVMGDNPKGVVVPWVDVLGVYGEDGEQIAVLFSHAAHSVIVHFFES